VRTLAILLAAPTLALAGITLLTPASQAATTTPQTCFTVQTPQELEDSGSGIILGALNQAFGTDGPYVGIQCATTATGATPNLCATHSTSVFTALGVVSVGQKPAANGTCP
jgi:hypothetical protein